MAYDPLCRWLDLVLQIFTVKILFDGLLKYGLNLNIDGPAEEKGNRCAAGPASFQTFTSMVLRQPY